MEKLALIFDAKKAIPGDSEKVMRRNMKTRINTFCEAKRTCFVLWKTLGMIFQQSFAHKLVPKKILFIVIFLFREEFGFDVIF